MRAPAKLNSKVKAHIGMASECGLAGITWLLLPRPMAHNPREKRQITQEEISGLNKRLNVDIILMVATYLGLYELLNASHTCRIWYAVAHGSSQYWAGVLDDIAPAHLAKIASWKDYLPTELNGAATRTARSRWAWSHSSSLQPRFLAHVDLSNRQHEVVSGTRWLLAAQGHLNPEELLSANLRTFLDVYDLYDGSWVGRVWLDIHTPVPARAPDLFISLSVSPTEVLVVLQRDIPGAGQPTLDFVWRIHFSQDAQGIQLTGEAIPIPEPNAFIALSSDGQFIALDEQRGPDYIIQLYHVPSGRVWYFEWVASDERCIYLVGDYFIVVANDRLRIGSVHLPSLLLCNGHSSRHERVKIPRVLLGDQEIGPCSLPCGKYRWSRLGAVPLYPQFNSKTNATARNRRAELVYRQKEDIYGMAIEIADIPPETARSLKVTRRCDRSVCPQEYVVDSPKLLELQLEPDEQMHEVQGLPCQRIKTRSHQNTRTGAYTHSFHVLGVDLPGTGTPISTEQHRELERTKIKWVDEASGLILMVDDDGGLTTLYAMWI